jgi:7,8-dihydropterin-6-yl-methyl-4-(beta-D-ribofuranosyl)aminobenzene 5'-phosphate synthase
MPRRRRCGDDVAGIRPRLIAPGHGTGWRATAALAQAFAPQRYGPSAGRTQYTLRAS